MTETTIPLYPFRKQPAPHSVLYRYLTIDKLLDFLFSRRIPMTRLNTFEDKLEGVTPKHLLVQFAKQLRPVEDTGNSGDIQYRTSDQFTLSHDELQRLRTQQHHFQENTYASCWYENHHECVAMWQLYSKPDSVAIRIPYTSLLQEITNQAFDLPPYAYEQIRYGSIDYYRFNDTATLTGLVPGEELQGFMKDSSFDHEQEFRFLLQLKSTQRQGSDPALAGQDGSNAIASQQSDIKFIPLTLYNFASLPFEIVFHPKSTRWHRDNIIKIIDKFELPFTTLESDLKNIFT